MSQNLLNASSPNYLHLIEWIDVINHLNKSVYFNTNKQKNLERPIHQPKHIIEKELSHLEHFAATYDFINFSAIPSDFDQIETLEFTKKGRRLEDPQILAIYWSLQTFNNNFKAFQKALSNIHNDFKSDTKVLLAQSNTILSSCVTENEIDYTRHPYVIQLIKQIDTLKDKGRNLISKVIKRFNELDVLQYSGFDFIEDVFVIPIRSDRYQAKLGRVVSQSNRGMTLYVEPKELIEINNELRFLKIQYQESTDKIREEISNLYYKNHQVLDVAISNCTQFDFYQGRAIFCKAFNLSRQNFSTDGFFQLEEFWHPLIENAVSNNISLYNKTKCLLISGPNAGGKTVILKTFILFQLLSHKGLFVSAKKATFPLYEKIYFISHDHQSVISGLSSFSSEVKAFEELYLDIPKNSMVCVDEIFRSTNSKEASCIALPMIKDFFQFEGVKFFITTHHPLLKEMTEPLEEIENAHVIFNKKTHRPTFQLELGSSSESFAIDTFQEISPLLGNKIADQANKAMVSHGSHTDELRHRLEKKIQQANKELKKFKKAVSELNGIRNHYEDLLKLKTTKKLEKIDHKLDKLLQSSKDSNQSRKKILNAKVEFYELNPERKSFKIDHHNSNSKISTPEVGQSYFSKTFKKSLEIKNINPKKQLVLCSHSGKQIWLPFSDLRGKPTMAKKEDVKIFVESNRAPSLEVDARGMRREEFQNVLNKVIYDVLNGKIPFLDIIHGFGDGILVKELKSFLIKYKDLEAENIDGNMGSTRISLKE